MVSVSRSAAPPHFGQVVKRQVGCSFNGLSPVGRHSTSSGSRMGIAHLRTVQFHNSHNRSSEWEHPSNAGGKSTNHADGNSLRPLPIPISSRYAIAFLNASSPGVPVKMPELTITTACRYGSFHYLPLYIGGISSGWITTRISNPIFSGKFKIALIMSRDSHDGTGTIGHQYIISNPDRDSFSIDRIDGITSCKNTGFLFIRCFTLNICLTGSLLDIFINLLSL